MTWLPLSKEGKFHRMRDGMLYNDAPEYYSGPLFLTAGERRTKEEVWTEGLGIYGYLFAFGSYLKDIKMKGLP